MAEVRVLARGEKVEVAVRQDGVTRLLWTWCWRDDLDEGEGPWWTRWL